MVRSPISGGISAVRTSVPSSLFRRSNESDPVFTSWLQSNNGIGNSLAARNSTLLEGVQNQLNTVSNQAVILSSSLQVIASNIATDSALEKQRAAAEEKRQRNLTEQGLRDDKEQGIENRIQAALMAPVRKVRSKIQFGLGRLMNFFLILTGGWLSLKVVDLLKADADGYIKLVEEIKGNILKGLLIIAGTFLLLKFGLAGIGLLVGRLGIRLAAIAFRGLLRTPLLFLKNFFVSLISKMRNWVWKNIRILPVPAPNPNQKLEKGGLIEGKSHSQGGENINAEGGEFVVNKESVKAIGLPILESLNNIKTIDATQKHQELMEKFGLEQRIKEVGVDQALLEFRAFKHQQQAKMVAPTIRVNTNYAEISPEVQAEFAKTVKNMMGEPPKSDYSDVPLYSPTTSEVEAKPVEQPEPIQPKVEPKVEPFKPNTSEVYQQISQNPEAEPTIIMAPAPEPEQQQQPVDNSTNSGAETGGFVPNIPARNFDNKYAFLAYKLYQVTPC